MTALAPADVMKRLDALTRASATGELVCAAPDLEVHVYLQLGRIAWATTSDAPLVFRRELCEHAQIELAAFRDVVEECRRTLRPIGETIVAWGLASPEEVRRCLASQIRRSLASLADRPDVDAVFLARGQRFHEYDVALTFELGDVAPSGPVLAKVAP